MTPKQRHEQQTKKYRELIRVTVEVMTNARKVVEQTEKARGKDLVAEMAIPEILIPTLPVRRHYQMG